MAKPRKAARLPRNVVRHRDKFRAMVMVNGKRLASQVVDTPAEAEALAAKLRTAGELSRGGEPLTLATAMDLLRRKQAAKGVRQGSIDFTEQKFRVLCRAWPATTYLHRIGVPQVERYMQHRRESGIGSQTIHHEVSLLKRLFGIGKRSHRLLSSPFDDDQVESPSVRNRRFEHLTRTEIESALQRIRAAAEKEPAWAWQADVFEFLLLTGLRRSELARLRVEDADPFKGTIAIKAKTEDRQVLPLSERAKEILGRLVAKADGRGFLVSSDVVDEVKAERARANAITHLIARWKQRLGLKLHGSAHSLRHSWATAAVESGAPQPDVQRAGRWKTAQMVMRYYHESEGRLRAVAEAVATGSMPVASTKDASKPRRQKSRAGRNTVTRERAAAR